MRIRITLSLAALAVVSAVTAPILAQSSDPAPATLTPPAASAPAPSRNQSVPVPSMPAYGKQRDAAPAAVPRPVSVPPPVAVAPPAIVTTPAPLSATPAEKTTPPAPLAEPATIQTTPQATATPAVPPTTPTGPPPNPFAAYVPYGVPDEDRVADHYGSAYIPVDSWVYPAMVRLYSMGYVDTMFLGMRPWTRRSALHMLQESQGAIFAGDNEEAKETLSALLKEFAAEVPSGEFARGTVYGTHSLYARVMGISGDTLRDSYHLGQTIVNDYGRPYAPGFNLIAGVSTLAEYGRFSFHLRAEYQHSPATGGYSQSLADLLSTNDEIGPVRKPNFPQATIPFGPQAAQNPFRIIEATLSYHLLGHEFSAGKSDAWLGPAAGGAMAWSNNAENIYSVRINRIEPLSIPLISKLLGPVRYDFFYGSLKGHTYPNHPYTHAEMFSFRPTKNFEFGFERTIIFGGAGHEPVTLHTFLKGFFSLSDTTPALKTSRNDPGARFSDFNFSYRLPFVRKYLTLYADSIAHDDVTPISAPRRAAFRTGVLLSQFPGAPKLDFRLEAVVTDPKVARSNNGQFNYYEIIQRQGYTNKGFIMGDWIGREAKGGQAWLTYHLSGNEWVQLEYLNKKTPHDFIPGGTTQNSFTATVVKRIRPDVELNAWFQHERWKAPIYLPGQRSNNTFTAQFTWFPHLHSTGYVP